MSAVKPSGQIRDSKGKPTPPAKSQYAHSSAGKGQLVQPGETLALLANVESEDYLAERLKQHGCDIYAGGPYATYADRLGACIVRNRMQAVVVGRSPEGRPETYALAYGRLYGKPLPKLEVTQEAQG